MKKMKESEPQKMLKNGEWLDFSKKLKAKMIYNLKTKKNALKKKENRSDCKKKRMIKMNISMMMRKKTKMNTTKKKILIEANKILMMKIIMIISADIETEVSMAEKLMKI